MRLLVRLLRRVAPRLLCPAVFFVLDRARACALQLPAGLLYLYPSVAVFRRRNYSDGDHIFAYNSVRWHLATNSFHQHVRLLMEISPHAFFRKNISIRWRNVCFSDIIISMSPSDRNILAPKMTPLKHTFLHRIEIFFQKKSMWRYLHEQAHMLVKGFCC